MTSWTLEFPDDFADYAWECESKGWFSGAVLVAGGKRYPLNFFGPVRLAQEIVSTLERASFFFEPNLVVVAAITREHMEKAAERLISPAQLSQLLPEDG